MERCPFCRADVERLDWHYSRNPPAGCPDVAVALDAKYWPFELRHDGHGQGGRRNQYPPLKRNAHGAKLCRCGRGVVVYRHACQECNVEYQRKKRRAQGRREVRRGQAAQVCLTPGCGGPVYHNHGRCRPCRNAQSRASYARRHGQPARAR